MYGSCGSLREAIEAFQRISAPNVYSWNILVTQLVRNGDLDLATRAFHRAPARNLVSFNLLLTAHTRQGLIGEARRIFDAMAERDGSSWNIMIQAYSSSGDLEEALVLFGWMTRRDVISWSTVITLYTRAGGIDVAVQMFDKMPQRNVIAIVSWNSMIQALALNGEPRAAIALYCGMDQEGIPPSDATFASILEACSIASALEQGMEIHRDIAIANLVIKASLASALVNFYGQCGGGLDRAREIFHGAPPAAVSGWNAMVAALARHGHGRQAVELFIRMLLEGMELDSVAFLGILTACGYAGMVEEARELFVLMAAHGIAAGAEHYHCLVEVVCRAGELERGVELTVSMPFHPGVIPWNMILNVCSTVLVDGKVGAWVGGEIMLLEPVESAPYVMLSNLSTACI
ncbi:hypothetical protein SELMODRAFT_90967 [Selaginella moellendorffii]|uniref:Pentacotripeptide-repeat region of PRORP domain-containing protein n=1 Tax=Selaginella moellendorffii TaxID=88036 RepID=D8RD65_SELML|nr:hypothetical protein SELMODRAFT_90967 [Selaginella moellendorffii]